MNLNFLIVLKILGLAFVIIAIAMTPPALISIYYGEFSVGGAFIGTMIPMILIGLALHRWIRPHSQRVKIREGLLIVALTWLSVSIAGAFPYMLTGVLPSFIDAFFESTSAFTTTGASLIPHIESVPRGLVFWRSFSQWLGGMGILVFAVSLLPALGVSGHQISVNETPGPSLHKLRPKMADSAKLLYLIYGTLTLIAILLFRLAGLNFFDAVIIAFGSMSSGGLMNYTDSAAHYASFLVEGLVVLFTVLSCINFTLYYEAVQGNVRTLLKDREFHVFLWVMGGGILLISWDLWRTATASSAFEALRFGLFHGASFATTTGLYTTDINLWPTFSKLILFLLVIAGANSASTGGGIKTIRVIVVVKLVIRGFFIRLHPRAIRPIKIQNRVIGSDSMAGIISFLILYLFIYLFSVFVVSFENLDLVTTFTATGAILNNVGTGFGLVGPAGTFAVFSSFTKVYLAILMIVGRLELFTILLLFMPSFWNPHRR